MTSYYTQLKTNYFKRYLVFLWLPIVFSCENISDTQANNTEPVKDSIVLNLNIETLKNISFYTIEDNFIRASIEVWEGFSDYRHTIEDLSKLNQKSLISFLEDTEKQTRMIRESPRPDYLMSLEIDSRLTLLETRVLTCKFYAQIQDDKKLNEELKLLYRDYNFWLIIVEDIAKQNIDYEQ